MNIIKNSRGTRIVIICLFLLINNLVISCSSDDIEPQTYKVVVHNQYFEKVSVSIGNEDKIEIMPSEKSRTFLLEKGDYKIRCLSKSNLLFTSTLSLKGVKGQVEIIIDNKGIRLN